MEEGSLHEEGVKELGRWEKDAASVRWDVGYGRRVGGGEREQIRHSRGEEGSKGKNWPTSENAGRANNKVWGLSGK